MAATSSRRFFRRGSEGSRYEPLLLAGVRIFAHSIAGLTAERRVVPVHHASAVAALGIAQHEAASPGNERVIVSTGVFNLKDAFAAAPAVGDIRKPVHATADDAVTLDTTKGFRLGHIEAIDDEGVWVRV